MQPLSQINDDDQVDMIVFVWLVETCPEIPPKRSENTLKLPQNYVFIPENLIFLKNTYFS